MTERERLEDYIAHAERMLSWTRTPCLFGAVRRQWERRLARLEARLQEIEASEAQD